MTSAASLATLASTSLSEAGFDLVVEHDRGRLVISGIVSTEGERAAALDIVNEVAESELEVDDNIEVLGAVPDDASGGLDLADGDVEGFVGATAGLEDPESQDPGDFTDQKLVDEPDHTQWAKLSDDGEPMGDLSRRAEDGEAYVPPTDPVAFRAHGGARGTSEALLDGIGPGRSSDGTIGDEALADAVRLALAEDAATAGLQITVEVVSGIVSLTGEVPDLVDAENAEEVASRVTGVLEVREDLVVARLEDEGERR